MGVEVSIHLLCNFTLLYTIQSCFSRSETKLSHFKNGRKCLKNKYFYPLLKESTNLRPYLRRLLWADFSDTTIVFLEDFYTKKDEEAFPNPMRYRTDTNTSTQYSNSTVGGQPF